MNLYLLDPNSASSHLASLLPPCPLASSEKAKNLHVHAWSYHMATTTMDRHATLRNEKKITRKCFAISLWLYSANGKKSSDRQSERQMSFVIKRPRLDLAPSPQPLVTSPGPAYIPRPDARQMRSSRRATFGATRFQGQMSRWNSRSCKKTVIKAENQIRLMLVQKAQHEIFPSLLEWSSAKPCISVPVILRRMPSRKQEKKTAKGKVWLSIGSCLVPCDRLLRHVFYPYPCCAQSAPRRPPFDTSRQVLVPTLACLSSRLSPTHLVCWPFFAH